VQSNTVSGHQHLREVAVRVAETATAAGGKSLAVFNTSQDRVAKKTAWVVAYTHKGKQHLKTFRTKTDATVWRAEMQHEVKRGIHTPATTSIAVAAAGAQWLAQAKTDELEASTVMQYRQRLNYHIIPFLGAEKLAELTPVRTCLSGSPSRPTPTPPTAPSPLSDPACRDPP
jgi:hypothetical protein